MRRAAESPAAAASGVAAISRAWVTTWRRSDGISLTKTVISAVSTIAASAEFCPPTTLLRKTFNLGSELDPRKPKALNRLELAKTLVGVAEANATAAKGLAIERGVGIEEIAGSELFALHGAALGGMLDAMFHLMERTISIIAGLGQLEPDDNDVLQDAARRAAAGLAGLFQWQTTAAGAGTREHPRAPRRSRRSAQTLGRGAIESGRRRVWVHRARAPGATDRQGGGRPGCSGPPLVHRPTITAHEAGVAVRGS
jgi:hypothetical protein